MSAYLVSLLVAVTECRSVGVDLACVGLSSRTALGRPLEVRRSWRHCGSVLLPVALQFLVQL